jgi:hypothetical protein
MTFAKLAKKIKRMYNIISYRSMGLTYNAETLTNIRKLKKSTALLARYNGTRYVTDRGSLMTSFKTQLDESRYYRDLMNDLYSKNKESFDKIQQEIDNR